MKSFTKRFHRGVVQSQRKLLRSTELESNLIHDNDTLKGVRMPPRLAPSLVPCAARRSRLVPRAVLLRASRRGCDPSSCWPWATSSSTLASSFMLTSLHWRAASRWAHVATSCFLRFRCMLHMFPLDVSKVDMLLHIYCSGYTLML
jgi:hypothetical protein